MLRFERLLLADEQSFVPRLTTGADAYRHGESSTIPPTASLFRERFIYDEQPFLRGYERATGRFWREAAIHTQIYEPATEQLPHLVPLDFTTT
jgi:hypothetical protein